jgi:hypothetical protein
MLQPFSLMIAKLPVQIITNKMTCLGKPDFGCISITCHGNSRGSVSKIVTSEYNDTDIIDYVLSKGKYPTDYLIDKT